MNFDVKCQNQFYIALFQGGQRLRENGAAKLSWLWEFPDGPVVKTSPSNAEGVGLIPGRGAR